MVENVLVIPKAIKECVRSRQCETRSGTPKLEPHTKPIKALHNPKRHDKFYPIRNITSPSWLLPHNVGPGPLSPVTQATIQKHLPGLPTRRLLMQQQYAAASAARSPPQPKVEQRDVACCTEVCSADNLPEVEVFSLLENQIPKLPDPGGHDHHLRRLREPGLVRQLPSPTHPPGRARTVRRADARGPQLFS
ncbi:hypothetical protein quinque_010678 [Culex quinquefasciatus]